MQNLKIANKLTSNNAKPEDQKTTATNLDLLLIMRNLKTKKYLQQIQIYFYLCETLKSTKN